MSDDDTVWIRTAPAPDGSTYVVTLEIGQDIAVILDHDRALAYAYEVLRAVVTAEYDAAVIAQLKDKGIPEATAVEVVRILRLDRPPPDDTATAPLMIFPGVSRQTRKPFLRIDIDDKQAGEWTLEDARSNALAVLEAHAIADLDSAYYRAMTNLVQVPPEIGRTMVGELVNYKDQDTQP